MDLGLKGLKAVLAGASKGIGRATAETLAAEGCDVAICARGLEGVEATVASLEAKGVKAVGEAVDMADGEAFRAWVGRAAQALGGCDIFISFASAGGGPASEQTWKAVFDLDLMATYRGVEAALPFLEQSKCGSIIAVSSTAALEDFFGPQAYNAIKAVPMGRLATGQEVAKAIAFMASPACPFMTGTNVVIDGGVTKRVQY